MTEDDLNALLDRLFLKHTGKTYAADPSPVTADSSDGDSLARIRRDFPDLFVPRIPTDPT